MHTKKKSFYLHEILQTKVKPGYILEKQTNFKEEFFSQKEEESRLSYPVEKKVTALLKILSLVFKEIFVFDDTMYLDKR